MILKSGFACIVKNHESTDLFGPSINPDLDYQNLTRNGLSLFQKESQAVRVCRSLATYLEDIGPVEIKPVNVELRIPETEIEEDLILMQRTAIIIGLPGPQSNGLNLENCILLGRHVEGTQKIAGLSAHLQSNGMKTFDGAPAKQAIEEYRLQTQHNAVLASFWYKLV